jgi:hypothetical protein
VIFHAAEQIHQIPVDVIINFQLTGFFLLGEQHPSGPAKHLDIAPHFIGGEPLQDGFPQQPFAADPSNTAFHVIYPF